MGMEHGQTIAEFSAKTGRNADTVYRFARRKFKGQNWSINSAVTPELLAALSAGKSAKEKRARSVRIEKKPETIRLPEKPAPPPEKKQALPDLHTVRRFSIRLLLFVAVIGHAGLVWYDLATLWGVPGTIGGGLMFAVMLAALGLASDRSLNRTSEEALWFVALLDFAAYFIHFEVFRNPEIGIWYTRALCALICACSWACLYLFRSSKLD